MITGITWTYNGQARSQLPNHRQLGQPLGTMTTALDAGARTGNGPTSVYRLNPIHHPGRILGERQIASPQLF